MESKRGNYERARELFEKGIDQDPFHAQIFHAYAEMEAKLVNIPVGGCVFVYRSNFPT